MNTLKYDELRKKQAILREQMLAEAKRFFAEESKALFEDHPKLESFAWTQYTHISWMVKSVHSPPIYQIHI